MVLGSGLDAGEYDIVYSSDGKAVFRFNYTDDPSDWGPSADWDIRADRYSDIRAALINGSQYWADMFGPHLNNTLPAPLTVYGSSDTNASAFSPITNNPLFNGNTEVGAMLLNNFDNAGEDVGIIEIGSWWPYYGSTGVEDPAYYYLGPVTHQPQNGDQMHLASTMLHELGHALGISSSATNNRFGTELSSWDKHLRDENDNPAIPGAVIDKTNDVGIFHLSTGSQARFVGENVMEVVGDAMPDGIPINSWEGTNAELSHIELRNSMMSHTQPYQNYATFLEAELAVMQDLGYDIDRKLYYGRSIYGDNGVIENTDGFDSLAVTGVGLHVYGTGNTITQLANIDSRGFGGLGIRVDGWDNYLTIAPDVTIRADGDQGRGIALAYGRDHAVIHQGVITADGADGRGLSFDFGSNAMGDYFDYRGSWIYQEVLQIPNPDSYVGSDYLDRTQGTPAWWVQQDRTDDAFGEVDGPLAEKVDISGGIRAKDAIYISENAFVKEINFLNGAELLGDITSKWRLDAVLMPFTYDTDPLIYFEKGFQFSNDDGSFGPNGEYGSRAGLFTTLTFGKAMDISGESLNTADDSFRMRYDGTINGASSMNMHIVGGELEYNGTASVFGVVNDGLLTGDATYNIGIAPVFLAEYDSGLAQYTTSLEALSEGFLNNGTLSPGGDDIGTVILNLGEDSFTKTVSATDKYNVVTDTPLTFYGASPSFTNSASGILAISFNAEGQHDTLEIRGTAGVNNTVDIGGKKSFQPVADFYAIGWSRTVADSDIIQTTDIDTANYQDTSTVGLEQPSSLTLRFDIASDAIAGTHTLSALRATDAYRSLAADPAGYAAASELDRIAALGGSTTDDLRRVFSTIDWMDDRMGVAAAEHSLAPVQQSEFNRVLLDNQFTMNRSIMNRFSGLGTLPGVRLSGVASDSGHASVPAGYHRADDEGTFFFFTPTGGGGRQSSRGWNVPGYSFWQAGAVLGVEKRGNGSVLGAHLSAGHVQLDGKSDELKSTGVYLGVHGRMSPADWCGWHVYGSVRAGVETVDQNREVTLGSVRGANKADWTGFAMSAMLGGGHDFDFGNFFIGPNASLEYALLRNPSFTEDGGLGRLDYQGKTYNSLRSNLGVRAGWEANSRVSYSVSAAWTHELLDRMGTTRAGFVGYGNSGMTIRARTAGRDSFTTSAALMFTVNDRTALSIEGGGEFFREGYTSGWGSVTVTRTF